MLALSDRRGRPRRTSSEHLIAGDQEGAGARRNPSSSGPFGISSSSVGRVAVTCDFCGNVAPGDDPPLTWTTAVEPFETRPRPSGAPQEPRGRIKRYCDSCSREHLRAMESKLESEWW